MSGEYGCCRDVPVDGRPLGRCGLLCGTDLTEKEDDQ